MARNILFFLMGLVMAWGLMMCQEAEAGHWIRTGTFDPGIYIACLVGNNGGDPVECLMTIADGSEREAQSNVDTLNEDPLSTPYDDYIVVWYHWDSGYWIKYKVPWQYIEGRAI